MTEIPAWVVMEIGRLHLHALALERALDDEQQRQEQSTPAPDDPA